PSLSKTSRTARSRTSGENLFVVLLMMLHPTQELEPPANPARFTAPLQVVEIDGVLRPFDPGDGLDDPGRALAREGWQTLRDYLADLAPILPRVDNHVPNLGRALTRLSAALGEAFDSGSPIAIGTHGQRVIRLARATGDSALPEDDVAELQEFAVALSLYLERFPEWRAYRDLAAETPANPETLRKTLPRIAEIEAALAERVGVDPTIPARLRDLRNLAQEDPQDPIAAAGLLDSFGNIMAALAHGLWRGIKATGKGLGWSVKTFAAKALETAAEKIAGAPFNPAVLTAADILLNKAAVLKSIAAAYPQKFVWLLHLLATLGL
ncbi:hypothetical protein, partial [Gemmobacter caeruleus]|uniref:hypothetical protein n=1 Tax=Gemmobacter caeruleus TaxID=2595004 RepID=UPI00193A5F45